MYFYKLKLASGDIVRALEGEEIKVSRSGVWRFLKKYNDIKRKSGSGRPSVICSEARDLIDTFMMDDDETTAAELIVKLREHGYNISQRIILRCRMQLGWTFCGSAYYQFIRGRNTEKRLAWARHFRMEATAGFRDVIFTDEITVQIESH